MLRDIFERCWGIICVPALQFEKFANYRSLDREVRYRPQRLAWGGPTAETVPCGGKGA
jgi:hypothetical protein